MDGRRPGLGALSDMHGGDHLLVMDGGDNLVATLNTWSQLQSVERWRVKTMKATEHRIASEIVQNHALIAIKDAGTRNLTKSAKGAAEIPGRKVTQKRGPNRSTLSQRWASISSNLEYTSPMV